MVKKLFYLLLLLPLSLAAQPTDWANYGRYAAANAALTTPPAVVFMGNSITDGWYGTHPEFFTGHNFAGRGISGQVTSQMLCRFRADVIALRPQAVVILAGTNDLALNNGPIAVEHIVENIVSMAELAQAAGIRPILCSVLPAAAYGWRPEVDEVPGKIRDLNSRLKEYAAERNFTWVDFWPALATEQGGMLKEYSRDGVHPTADGYTAMEEVLLPLLTGYVH